LSRVLRIAFQACRDRVCSLFLHLQESVVCSRLMTSGAHLLGHCRHTLHHRVRVGEHRVLRTNRVHGANDIRDLLAGHRPDEWLEIGPVVGETDLRYPVDRREGAIIGLAVAPEGAHIVEGAHLKAAQEVAGYEIRAGLVRSLRRDDQLVESWRQTFDDVHRLHDDLMLALGDLRRDEDREMADLGVDAIDDRLALRPDVVDAFIEIEDPTERLLRRADVVAERGEHNDRRGDVADVEQAPVGGRDFVSGQFVADEMLVDEILDLLAVELDEVAPPFLEAEESAALRCRPLCKHCATCRTACCRG
jgi:hypothetical protein